MKSISLGFFLIPLVCSSYFVDNYTPVKWAALYLIAILALVELLLSRRTLYMPSWGAWAPLALIAAWIPCLINPGHYEGVVLDAIAGIILILAVYTRNGDSIDVIQKWNIAATVCVLFYMALQMFHVEPFPLLWHNNYPASTFGFQNMTAEFLGISFLLQFFGKTRPTWWTFALIFLTGVAILSMECRTVILAVMAANLAMGSFKMPKRAALASGIIVVLIVLFTLSNQSKTATASTRLIRWANTATMIYDHPMGVGPGNYGFEYTHYKSAYKTDTDISEHYMAKSPHNAYLGLAAEWGLPFFFIVLMAIISLFYSVKDPLFRGVLVFLLVDAIFAFPMDCAYLYFVAAVILGMGLKQIPLKLVEFKPYPMVIVFFTITALSFSFVYSKFVESSRTEDLEANHWACLAFPSNWRPCAQEAFLLGQSGHDVEAEAKLRKILEKSPSNYAATRLLAWSLLRQNRQPAGLEQVKKYDDLFDGRTEFHGMVSQ